MFSKPFMMLSLMSSVISGSIAQADSQRALLLLSRPRQGRTMVSAISSRVARRLRDCGYPILDISDVIDGRCGG